MAKVRVDLDYVIYNGSPVTFNAPCDCTAADGLIIYHPEGYQSFTFCDAHGENLSGIGDVFVAGVPVKVILDTENSRAFVQNGDNNTHLNSMLSSMLDRIGVLEMGAVCESGSYVGTQKDYSSSYTTSCSLTFDFVPKFLLIMGGGMIAFLFPSYAVSYAATVFYYMSVAVDDTTITWSVSSFDSDEQAMNAKGTEYHYIAFG